MKKVKFKIVIYMIVVLKIVKNVRKDIGILQVHNQQIQNIVYQ